jgi:uncharacterized protein
MWTGNGMTPQILVTLRRALWRPSLLLVMLVLAAGAHAATFPNLYGVTVTPDPNAANARAAATEAALARVLVRVTGRRGAPLDPQLLPLLKDPSRYVNSYGVDRQGRPQVSFNATRLDQTLNELNLPVWGPERPLTLLWIAVDDSAGGRALLPANELGADLSPAMVQLLTMIRTELTAVADERGLPIALPLIDLEDLNAVTFTDVWGGFEDRVALASVRYRADAVLIGRVRPAFGGYEVQWLLLKDKVRQPIDGVALRDGLDAVADLYALELSVVGGASTTRLTVLDVATPAEYGRVMSYLEGLSVLQAVDVESLERGVLSLRVAARGDARLLERVLALGGVLSPDSAGSSSAEGSLVFRLARSGSP